MSMKHVRFSQNSESSQNSHKMLAIAFCTKIFSEDDFWDLVPPMIGMEHRFIRVYRELAMPNKEPLSVNWTR